MVCSDSLWCADEDEVGDTHSTLRVLLKKEIPMNILKLLDSIPVWFDFSVNSSEVRKILRQTDAEARQIDAEALASDWKAIAEDFEMILPKEGKKYGKDA